jgi:metal-sulfur cluster biosynthetic enzyme
MDCPDFEYSGDPLLREAVTRALARVVDPEMAVDIVGLGLVYGVDIADDKAQVRITMTSPACPVAGLIVDEVGTELAKVLGARAIEVEVVWDPPWSPERMSQSARRALDWE